MPFRVCVSGKKNIDVMVSLTSTTSISISKQDKFELDKLFESHSSDKTFMNCIYHNHRIDISRINKENSKLVMFFHNLIKWEYEIDKITLEKYDILTPVEIKEREDEIEALFMKINPYGNATTINERLRMTKIKKEKDLIEKYKSILESNYNKQVNKGTRKQTCHYGMNCNRRCIKGAVSFEEWYESWNVGKTTKDLHFYANGGRFNDVLPCVRIHK